MVEISVIIPAYNAIDYMDESLDSIINQSFKDLEIICVDDGSTDNTLERLEYYASKDSRIQVYTQENQGPGGATNTGLSKAKGKYIYFMDADDILELNALEELYDIIEEKNVDFVIFKAINYDQDTGEYFENRYYTMPILHECVGDSIFNWRDIGETIFSICVTPWSKLYKHDVIKKSGAKFPLHLIYHDNLFFWDILFNSDRIYFHDKFLYRRRVHSSSLVNSHNEKSVQTIKTSNLITQKFIDYGYFEDFKAKLYNRKVYLCDCRYRLIRDEFKDFFFIEMKKDFEKILPHEKYDDFYSNLNYAEVDLPSGEYLWNVISVSDRYGMSVYEISFEDEKTLLRCIFKRDEESILQNMVYLNAPIFGARKDTRMLATNWGNKAAANRWNEIHKLTDPINEEEEWRCWAVAFNVLNKHYNGNLTQDEIKILGMKESLKNYYPFTKKNGEFAPLMYFPLGVLGGAGDEVIPVLYSEIFKMNDVKLNYLKSGVMPKHSVYKDVMKSDAENEINVTTFRKRLEAKRPILVITTNSNGSGHIMIIDGYATSGDDFCYSDDKSTCVVRKGDPVFHFINTDNNGSHYWASANSYRYKAYYVMEKPSFVLNRDPLLNDENNDADKDGVIAYDEVKRFGTDPDKWDYDEDGISDFNEIYAMVDRCTNLKVDLVDENGEKTGEKVEVGCTNFEYYDSDGDGEPTYRDLDSDNGGVKDGAEDLNGNGKLDPGETDPYLESDDKKIEIVQKSYDLPDGITIFGRERVALNDGVVCYNSTKTDGDYCDIVSSSRDSKSTIILGVWAKVRNIYTRGGMWLRVKSVVDGFVAPYTLPSLKHPIKKDIDVTIRGKSDALNTIAFPYSDEFDTWTLDEEPKLEHVVKDGEVFEWKESDKYKTLKVEAGGKLVLNPGTFIAKELILDRKSAVEFTKPGEATQVVAMDFLNWRTEIINEDLPLVARGFKLITYMQSERLYTLGINWAGTLYAPKSYVVFGQASNKLMYGRFYADIAIVHQRTKVVRVDYDPIVPEVVPEEDEEEEEQEPVEGEGQEPVVAEDDQEPTDDDPSENEGDAFAKRHYDDDMVQESVVSPLAAELKGFSRNGIVFETKSAGIVKINIMSANGIMVKSFSAGNLEAGTHSVAWNSDNVPSGRYLVTLSQNGKVSGKFVSLK